MSLTFWHFADPQPVRPGWYAAQQSVSLAWRGVGQARQPTFTYIRRALQRSAASPGGENEMTFGHHMRSLDDSAASRDLPDMTGVMFNPRAWWYHATCKVLYIVSPAYMNSYRDPARLLRVMAHPMRLEILDIIRRSDECVCHLSAALDKPQPYVSQQLAILRNAGLIVDRKEGNLVFYGLAGGPAALHATEILGALAGGADVGRIANSPQAGRRGVAGCTCPKCEADGACEPRDNGS
jgi:ArsR family transcriptional regulator